MKDKPAFTGYPCDGRVYLVCEINNTDGFYVCNGEPIYASKAIVLPGNVPAVDTECLQLRLGAKLKVVSGNRCEGVQRFDMIRLIRHQNEKELAAFVDLCGMHANGTTNLTFEEFFYSLNSLFKPLRTQSALNAMGLYGELSIIDATRKLGLGAVVSSNWQLAGLNSKYDFTFCAGNIEVKTASTQKLKVLVKHDQLFNDGSNHLAVVLLEKAPNGETLEQLAQRLLESTDCFVDFHSQAVLTGQLLRVDEKGLKTPYFVRGIRCYASEDIDFFGNISDRVFDLNYRLDLADLKWTFLKDMLNTVLGH